MSNGQSYFDFSGDLELGEDDTKPNPSFKETMVWIVDGNSTYLTTVFTVQLDYEKMVCALKSGETKPFLPYEKTR